MPDEFIYATSTGKNDYYNINPCSYTYIEENGISRYFTVSRTGVTAYKNDKVVDFEKLPDWMASKVQFNKLQSVTFVKKFRKIKILNGWRTQITKFKRAFCKRNLELKLPIADKNLRELVFRARRQCLKLENTSFFGYPLEETLTIEELEAAQ